MADRHDDEAEDPPLDPAMQRIQARLRRLILVSGATLGIGLLAVMVAIVFRLNAGRDGAPSGAAFQSTIEVPAGGTLVATDIDGDRLLVTTDGPQGRVLHLYHMPTGRHLGSSVLITR